jgi:hypothetical protein
MTHEKWIALTPEQRRTKVAELCGWKSFPLSDGCPDYWEKGEDVRINGRYLPDYLHDLNAMREAVNTLTDAQYNTFCDLLWNFCGGASGKAGAINASAAQRAEAFVLTLEPE